MFSDTTDSRHLFSWRRVLCGVGLLAGLLLGQPASANPVLVGTTDNATGVTGLLVDGHLYDATFIADTYANVFATTAPIFGNDTATAADALVALTNALNALGVTTITGPSAGGIQALVIPDSAVSGGIYNAQQTLFGYAGSYWSAYPSPSNSNSAVSATLTYGHNDIVVLTAESVPEPGSLALLATGCAAWGFWGQRRRRAH